MQGMTIGYSGLRLIQIRYISLKEYFEGSEYVGQLIVVVVKVIVIIL